MNNIIFPLDFLYTLSTHMIQVTVGSFVLDYYRTPTLPGMNSVLYEEPVQQQKVEDISNHLQSIPQKVGTCHHHNHQSHDCCMPFIRNRAMILIEFVTTSSDGNLLDFPKHSVNSSFLLQSIQRSNHVFFDKEKKEQVESAPVQQWKNGSASHMFWPKQ